MVGAKLLRTSGPSGAGFDTPIVQLTSLKPMFYTPLVILAIAVVSLVIHLLVL